MTPTIFPVLRYADAPAAIDWLVRAFDFEKQAVFDGPGGTIAHAELRKGPGVIGISSAAASTANNPWSTVRQGVYVTVDDVDAHCARARAAGARIATEPYDTHYGARDYSAWDPEGHLWGFGTYPMGSPQGEPNLFAEFVYTRGADAIDWLERAFGFVTTLQVPGPDGVPMHAEMRYGDSWILLNLGQPASSGTPAQAISVRVDDPDAVFARATAAGATAVMPPTTMHYGARSCWVRDPENFSWGFSTYQPVR